MNNDSFSSISSTNDSIFWLFASLVQIYYGTILSSWLSVAVTYLEVNKRPVTRQHACDFALFASGISNGNSPCAEVARLVMDYDRIYSGRSDHPLKHEEGESSLYDLVIAICQDNTWKAVGSSAPNRHQVCTQGKLIPEWKNVGPPALKVLDKFNIENCKSHCISDKNFEKLLREVEKLPLMGNVTSHHFVHCAAMFGLIPYCIIKNATLSGASSKGRGPNKLINACCRKNRKDINDTLSPQECDVVFRNIHKELASIWNGTIISKMWLENCMCELWRIVRANTKLKAKEKICASDVMACFQEMGLNERLMLGTAKDPVYMFRHNCTERKVQPLFKFRSDSTGIEMLSHVIRNPNLVEPLTASEKIELSASLTASERPSIPEDAKRSRNLIMSRLNSTIEEPYTRSDAFKKEKGHPDHPKHVIEKIRLTNWNSKDTFGGKDKNYPSHLMWKSDGTLSISQIVIDRFTVKDCTSSEGCSLCLPFHALVEGNDKTLSPCDRMKRPNCKGLSLKPVCYQIDDQQKHIWNLELKRSKSVHGVYNRPALRARKWGGKK